MIDFLNCPVPNDGFYLLLENIEAVVLGFDDSNVVDCSDDNAGETTQCLVRSADSL